MVHRIGDLIKRIPIVCLLSELDGIWRKTTADYVPTQRPSLFKSEGERNEGMSHSCFCVNVFTVR